PMPIFLVENDCPPFSLVKDGCLRTTEITCSGPSVFSVESSLSLRESRLGRIFYKDGWGGERRCLKHILMNAHWVEAQYAEKWYSKEREFPPV
ncbi:MAG TPA: hypothetical protein PKM72_05480, partial [Nitrospirales bacterium]|nr:hypothetical protein [Nitrospirales bacterium]